jgi:hypothetical protein
MGIEDRNEELRQMPERRGKLTREETLRLKGDAQNYRGRRIVRGAQQGIVPEELPEFGVGVEEGDMTHKGPKRYIRKPVEGKQFSGR